MIQYNNWCSYVISFEDINVLKDFRQSPQPNLWYVYTSAQCTVLDVTNTLVNKVEIFVSCFVIGLLIYESYTDRFTQNSHIWMLL